MTSLEIDCKLKIWSLNFMGPGELKFGRGLLLTMPTCSRKGQSRTLSGETFSHPTIVMNYGSYSVKCLIQDQAFEHLVPNWRYVWRGYGTFMWLKKVHHRVMVVRFIFLSHFSLYCSLCADEKGPLCFLTANTTWSLSPDTDTAFFPPGQSVSSNCKPKWWLAS